jgi:hypothetical protein
MALGLWPATSNACIGALEVGARRALRGVVIARKVSHCSKNQAGARIYEAMKSITATLAARGYHVAKGLASIINSNPMPSCR